MPPERLTKLIGVLRARMDPESEKALHGLVLEASRPGAEPKRLMLSNLLAEALASPSNPELKRFLMTQLELIGGQEAVPALVAFLSDPEFVGPAARALAAQRTLAADRGLLHALLNVRAPFAPHLMQALADSQLPEVDAALLAKVDTPECGDLARDLLARRGAPQAVPLLLEEAQADKAGARTRILRLAGSMARAGHAEPAARLARTLARVPWATTPQRCAALSALAAALGPKLLPDLLQAQDDPDPVYREHALLLAETLPGSGATEPWLPLLASAPPGNATEIAAMLGRRGDRLALPAVLALFAVDSELLRLAAIPAAFELSRAAAVPALLTLLEWPTPAEVSAARTALLGIDTADLISPLLASLARLAPPAQILALDIFGIRGAIEAVEATFALAECTEPGVALAALRTLARIARPPDLPRLALLIRNAKSQAERSAAIRAAVHVARTATDPEQRCAPFLTLLENTAGPPRAALLTTLGRIGGRDALAALRSDCASSDPTTRHAALRALGEWPDAEALALLLTLCSETPDLEGRALALRGLLAVLARAALSAPENASWLERAFSAAPRPEEKRLVLARLGDLEGTLALASVLAALADPELLESARATALRILSRFETGPVPKDLLPLLDVLSAQHLEPHHRTLVDSLRGRTRT